MIDHSRHLIDRYERGGPLLRYAVSGLSLDHERAPSGPGTWNIAALAAHLLDSDLVFADRIKRLLSEPDPILLAFDEEAWLARLGSDAMPAAEAADLLAANRRWMTRILRRCSDADFALAGQHSRAGRKTMAEVVVTAVSHLDHHLRFLYGKRAILGDALPPRYSAE